MLTALLTFGAAATTALGAFAATLSYTPQGTGPYYWADDTAWGGTKPTSADTVEIEYAALLASPLVIGAGTSATVVGGHFNNGIIEVDEGASFTSTANISLASKSGNTCVVTNCGTMSFSELDLGCYNSAGYQTAKGILAQFDNFGTVNVSSKFRLGVRGTKSVFYNHEGATFNKTGGTDWTFYMATEGGDSTIINEGTMTTHASGQTWSGNNPGGKSEFIMRKSGTFNPGSIFRIGHGSGTTTINLYDKSRLLGATNYRVGHAAGSKGYITLSNESAFVTSGGVNLGLAANTIGSILLADSASAEFNGVLSIGVAKDAVGTLTLTNSAAATAAGETSVGSVEGSRGRLTLGGDSVMSAVGKMNIGIGAGTEGEVHLCENASLSTLNSCYIGYPSATGTVVLAGSSVMTNKNEAFVLGNGTGGYAAMTVKDSARFVNEATGYMAHGQTSPTEGATAYMTFAGNSRGEFGHYLHVASSSNSCAALAFKDSASATFAHNLKIGVHTKTRASLTVEDNARLEMVGDPASYAMYVANGWMSSAHAYVTNGGFVSANVLKVADATASTGVVEVAGATVVASNIVVGSGGNAVGTFTVGEDGVVSNVYQIQLGYYSTKWAELNMRGGTMLFKPGQSENSTVIWLNPSLSSLKASIRGWGKLAFEDPRAAVTDRDPDTEEKYLKPGGITHYGQIIADGEGQMRDLDFGRLGVLNYESTVPNQNGATNGWFAVNKGRLKLPRSLPRKNAAHHCVGDYWKLTLGKTGRLMNTFTYELDGAEFNNYMFAELYATDRDDIPAGLDAIGADKTLAVWRIGHFSDGPEIDEPTHPAAFTSASIRFRYCPAGAESLKYVYVFRHDGTPNGEWKKVGVRALSTSNPIVYGKVSAPSTENWNLGWFAVVAREERFAGLYIGVR